MESRLKSGYRIAFSIIGFVVLTIVVSLVTTLLVADQAVIQGITNFDSVTLGQDLSVGNDATVSNDLTIDNDLTVAEDFAVSGDAVLSGSTLINDNLAVTGTLHVTSTVDFEDEVLFEGEGDFRTQIVNDGANHSGRLYIADSSEITGTLNVGDAVVFASTLSVGDDVTLENSETFSNSDDGWVEIGSVDGVTLTVTGGDFQIIGDATSPMIVSGYTDNTVSGTGAVVIGGGLSGSANIASGDYTVVVGGLANEATGDYSLAYGRRAKALHTGTFVWSDSTDADYASTSSDSFNIRATNGVTFTTSTQGLTVTGGDNHFGGNANYTEISGDGVIALYGNARTINAVWIDAGGIKAPGLKPAAAIAHGTLETPAWEFGDENVEANQETVSFNIRVPNRMDRTVAPSFSVGWSANGVSPGVVEWQLEYLWTSLNESTAAAAQETLTVTSTASTTSDGLVLATFYGIDLASATDACMHGRLMRLSAGSNDTIVDTTELHGVCFGWTSNKIGTAP